MISLTVLLDKSERVHYNFDNFLLYSHVNELYSYGYEAACHWHPDLEFIYIISGNMDYYVNGNIIHLHEGQGIFVNSCRMHYGFSKERNDCKFICTVIHPRLFAAASEAVDFQTKYRISMKNADYILLSVDVPWQKTLIDNIVALNTEIYKSEPSYIQLLAKSVSICADICDHIESVDLTEKHERMQIEFLEMTEFIHNNYQQKITLDDIANAGTVSRSKCCRLFKQFIQQAPNVYLTNYRLTKSTELLRDSDLPVTDIALACGFQTASYYTNVFKQEMNVTPLHYRKMFRERITG